MGTFSLQRQLHLGSIGQHSDLEASPDHWLGLQYCSLYSLNTACAGGFVPSSPLWQKFRLMISGDDKVCCHIHSILLHCWKDLCTGRVSHGAFRWFGLNMQVPSHDFEQVERRNLLHLNLGFDELLLASDFTFWYLLMLGDLQWYIQGCISGTANCPLILNPPVKGLAPFSSLFMGGTWSTV